MFFFFPILFYIFSLPGSGEFFVPQAVADVRLHLPLHEHHDAERTEVQQNITVSQQSISEAAAAAAATATALLVSTARHQSVSVNCSKFQDFLLQNCYEKIY